MILACLMLLWGSTVLSQKKTITLGVAPHMDGGDQVEKNMYALLGQWPGIEHIITPSDPDELFDKLLEYEEKGYEIDGIVIAGHGSSDYPRIDLGEEPLDASAVDVDTLQEEVDRLEKSVEDRRAKGLPTDRHEASLQENRARIDRLNSISKVMAPGAEVKLINCSPAATKEGETFVNNLAKVLVSDKGGKVVASKADVNVDQVTRLSGKLFATSSDGETVPLYDFFADGEWVQFPIPVTIDFDDVPTTYDENAEKKKALLTGNEWAEKGVTFSAKKNLGTTSTVLGHTNYSSPPNGLTPGLPPWNRTGPEQGDNAEDSLTITFTKPVLQASITVIDNAPGRGDSITFFGEDGGILKTMSMGNGVYSHSEVRPAIKRILIKEEANDGDDVAYDDLSFSY